MDAAVLSAITRWPNVPNVNGWLSLDRRGRWRLQDSPIDNPRIADFIGRNYESDDHGAWFFQNGPQRVYVRLDYTPWVLRIGDGQNLTTHTGHVLQTPTTALLDESGNLLIAFEHGLGLVDDRDLAALLASICNTDGQQSSDVALTDLMDGKPASLQLKWNGKVLPLTSIHSNEVASRYNFVAAPQPA